MDYFVPAIDDAYGGECQSNFMLFIVLFACLVFIYIPLNDNLISDIFHATDKAMHTSKRQSNALSHFLSHL